MKNRIHFVWITANKVGNCGEVRGFTTGQGHKFKISFTTTLNGSTRGYASVVGIENNPKKNGGRIGFATNLFIFVALVKCIEINPVRNQLIEAILEGVLT